MIRYPVEIEREARRMRAEAVSLWLSNLGPALRSIAWNLAGFIKAFRAFPGVRA